MKKNILFVALESNSFKRFRFTLVKMFLKKNWNVTLALSDHELSTQVKMLKHGCTHNIKKFYINLFFLIDFLKYLRVSSGNHFVVTSFFLPSLLVAFIRQFKIFQHIIILDGLGFQFTKRTQNKDMLRLIVRKLSIFFYKFSNYR